MESSPAPVSTRAAPLVTITSLPAVPIKVIPGSPVWVGVSPLHSAAAELAHLSGARGTGPRAAEGRGGGQQQGAENGTLACRQRVTAR